MRCIVRIVLALILLAPAWGVAPALAEGTTFRPDGSSGNAPAPAPVQVPAADWGNSRVDIAYREPSDAQFAPIRERLMKRQVLEQLRLFLSPLKLPRKLLVQTDQCGADRRPYVSGGPVTVCYEYIARINRMAPRDQPAGSLPPELMVVGAVVQAVLHEVSVAVFDILELPVWGREEDAADKLAGFIMVQFGKEVALKVMVGAAWFFDASERTWTGTDFANPQSTEAQRFYNYLCIAFGSDPATFKFLLDQNLLPARRAQRCTVEYYKLRAAFHSTILRHVDEPLLKRVQSANWLMLDASR